MSSFIEEFGFEGVIEHYIKEKLSIRLDSIKPGYYEKDTKFKVELLLDDEVISTSYTHVRIPE